MNNKNELLELKMTIMKMACQLGRLEDQILAIRETLYKEHDRLTDQEEMLWEQLEKQSCTNKVGASWKVY
jgi:hypothetical protein